MSSSKRRVSRIVIVSVIAGLALIAGIIVAVAVSIRVEEGEWRVPTKGDFVRIARRFDNTPPKVIYLERNSIELSPGEDDAARGISSVLQNAGTPKLVKSKAWSGGDAKWKQLVACVKAMYAPFNVTVTDERPTTDNFMLVVVGGKPTDLGIKNSHHVSGLAPFNGDVIPRAVVFAFAATANNDVQSVCETVGMETAHAYGLDHGYHCKDVMTYLTGCGKKEGFVDKDVRCGESKARDCEGGKPTQNSFRHLLAVLGPVPGSEPPAAAPTVATPVPTTTTPAKTTKTTTKTTKTPTKTTTTKTPTKTTTTTTHDSTPHQH